MYYELKAEDTVRLPPNMLVMKLKDAITKILREKYERRLFRGLGMVVAVEDVDVGEQGTVIPGDGGIYYKVQFNAISFLPHVNEVYAGQVREIVEFGAFASIGPLDGLIHISQIGNEKFFYDKKTKALSTKRGTSLKKGDAVLLKVSTVSLKGTTTDTKIGLTMRSEGLGVMRWEKERKAAKSAVKKAKKEAKK
jgi:DNA-directed RNA polymerase subunit E'